MEQKVPGSTARERGGRREEKGALSPDSGSVWLWVNSIQTFDDSSSKSYIIINILGVSK